MVLCGRPVTEVCPVRWAAMDNRSVLQWDKDDCAEAGLVKSMISVSPKPMRT